MNSEAPSPDGSWAPGGRPRTAYGSSSAALPVTSVPLTRRANRIVLLRVSTSRPSPRTREPSSREISTSLGPDTSRRRPSCQWRNSACTRTPCDSERKRTAPARCASLARGEVQDLLRTAGGDRISGSVVLGVTHVFQGRACTAPKVPYPLGADLGHDASVTHDGMGGVGKLRVGYLVQELIGRRAGVGVIEAARGDQCGGSEHGNCRAAPSPTLRCDVHNTGGLSHQDRN